MTRAFLRGAVPVYRIHSIRKRFLALVVVGVVLVTVPGAAQQQVDPLGPILDFFQSESGTGYAAQFLVNPTPGASTVSDPVGDFEHSSGQPPGYTPGHIDIVDTWIVRFDPGPIGFFTPTDAGGLWAPTGAQRVEPPNFDPLDTFTGEMIHDGAQYNGGALMFGFTLADTPPPTVNGRCEFVVWINDLTRGPTFVNHPSFPGDPAGGTNVAYGLALSPVNVGPSSTFALGFQQDTGGFTFEPMTDVRAFITPNFVGITVPESVVADLAGINFYTFCADEGASFEPENSGADQTGLFAVTADDAGSVAISEMIVVTTVTEPTTTTTHAPPPTAAGPSQPEVVVEDQGLPWWPFLVAGSGIAALGWWLLTRKSADRCQKLYDTWTAARDTCDAARAKATTAADECGSAERALEEIDQARKEVCSAWPPACWATREGDVIEDERGRRISAWDVHVRKVALGEIWSDYKAGKLSAREVEARWREMDTPQLQEEIRTIDEEFRARLQGIEADLDAARKTLEAKCDRADEARAESARKCEAAAAARKAYEECIAATDPDPG